MSYRRRRIAREPFRCISETLGKRDQYQEPRKVVRSKEMQAEQSGD